MNHHDLARCLAHPRLSLRELDRLDAESSLLDFVSLLWHVVEPDRPFVRGWAVEAIAEHLEAVSRGEIKKLLMNVPPGFMKSLMTGVFWPAWEWGPRNMPGKRYLCASYAEDLTIRDNMRCRRLLGSDEYQAQWGQRFQFDPSCDAKTKFANLQTGWKIATSVDGTATGERGDRVIIDDPHSVKQAESEAKRNGTLQWFTEVMPNRVNDKKTAAFVVIMQRVHEGDVSGLILDKGLGYEHLCIPMHWDPLHPWATKNRSTIGWRDPRADRYERAVASGTEPTVAQGELAFPERFDAAGVDDEAKTMMSWGGTYAVAGQHEQRPEPRGGGMVKRDWFEIVDRVPDLGYRVRCRGWDFAGTEGGDGAGTASVLTCEVWLEGGDTDLYVEDCTWERLSPGGVYEFIKATLKADGWEVFQSLPQDPAQAGKYQVDDMLALFSGHDFEFTPESGDKEVRFRPWAAQAETRNKVHRRIKLVRGPWNEQYLDHLSKFPKGRYKDIPDAQSRSYGGVVRRGGGTFLSVGGSTLLQPSTEYDMQGAA